MLLLFFSLSDLSMNSIRHIPGELFQGTKKLAVLHLSGNYLKDLPKHIFQDLVHLEELDLSNNALTEIQTGVFRGMYYLQLFYQKYINFVWKCQNDIYTTLSCKYYKNLFLIHHLKNQDAPYNCKQNITRSIFMNTEDCKEGLSYSGKYQNYQVNLLHSSVFLACIHKVLGWHPRWRLPLWLTLFLSLST